MAKADSTLVAAALKHGEAKGPFSTKGMFDSYIKQRGKTMQSFNDMVKGAFDAAETATKELIFQKDVVGQAIEEMQKDPETTEATFNNTQKILKDYRKNVLFADDATKRDAQRKTMALLDGIKEDTVGRVTAAELLHPDNNLTDYGNTDNEMLWGITQAMKIDAGEEAEGGFTKDSSTGRDLYSGTYTYPEGHPSEGETYEFKDVSITDLVKGIEQTDFKAIGAIEKIHQDVETFSRENKFHTWDDRTIDKTIKGYKTAIKANMSGFGSIATEDINGQPSLASALKDPSSEVGQIVLKELLVLNPGLDSNNDEVLDEKDTFMTKENYVTFVNSLTRPRVRGKSNPNFNKDLSVDLMARYFTSTHGNYGYEQGRKLAGHDMPETVKTTAAERLVLKKEQDKIDFNKNIVTRAKDGQKLIPVDDFNTAVLTKGGYVVVKNSDVNKDISDLTPTSVGDFIEQYGGIIGETKALEELDELTPTGQDTLNLSSEAVEIMNSYHPNYDKLAEDLNSGALDNEELKNYIDFLKEDVGETSKGELD